MSPSPPPPSLPADQTARLVSVLAAFLSVATHTLLRHRALYPAASFLPARAFDLSVHQSRHPGVCAWIRDAVAAVAHQLHHHHHTDNSSSNDVRAVVLAVHAPRSMRVLERWVFDLQLVPPGDDGGELGATGAGNRSLGADRDDEDDEDDDEDEEDDEEEEEEEDGVNWTDVKEALRGALQRIVDVAARTAPLPPDCTFTMAIELRDEAPAPITRHPHPWIPANTTTTGKTRGESTAATETKNRQMVTQPIRSVHAGPLFFECWLERRDVAEGSAELPTS